MHKQSDLFVKALYEMEKTKPNPRTAMSQPRFDNQQEMHINNMLEPFYTLVSDIKGRNPRDPKRPIPDVIGGVIAAGTINAVAFPDLTRPSPRPFYIGINWGAPHAIFEIFRRLLSHKDVLPWIGESSQERPRAKFKNSPLRSNIEATWGSYYDPTEEDYPTDKLRQEAAVWLSRNTYSALIMHELRHVYGGHLEHNLSKYGISFIEEMQFGGLSNDDGLRRQAYEIDADTAAVLVKLANMFAMISGNHPDMGDSKKFMPEPKHAVECTLLSMDVFFKLFDSNDVPSLADWPSFAHPPSFIRRSNITDVISFVLDHHGLHDLKKEMDDEIMPRVTQISDKLINELFGRHPDSFLSAKLSPGAIDYKNRIRQTLKDMWGDLSRFRYFDSDADSLAMR